MKENRKKLFIALTGAPSDKFEIQSLVGFPLIYFYLDFFGEKQSRLLRVGGRRAQSFDWVMCQRFISAISVFGGGLFPPLFWLMSSQ